MSDTCYRTEELETIAELPPGDPRLRHLSACPRCRSLLRSYREFLAGEGLPGEGDLSEVDRRLADAIERKMQSVSGGGRTRGAGESRRPMTRRDLGWDRLRRWSGGPIWKPALGLAAIAVVALVVGEAVRSPGERDGRVVLRGESVRPGEIAVTQAPEFLADGSVRLGWPRQPDADGYRVVLLGPDGRELAALDAGPDAVLVLDPSRLPGSASSGGVLWRVEALRDGDVIARSRVAALPLP